MYYLEYIDRSSNLDKEVMHDRVKVLINSRALFSIIGSAMAWVEDKLSTSMLSRTQQATLLSKQKTLSYLRKQAIPLSADYPPNQINLLLLSHRAGHPTARRIPSYTNKMPSLIADENI